VQVVFLSSAIAVILLLIALPPIIFFVAHMNREQA
jgi:hypothetical protein